VAADAQRGVEREGLGAAHVQRRKARAPRQARGEEQRVAPCQVAPVLDELGRRAREEGPVHFGAHLRVTEAVASMAWRKGTREQTSGARTPASNVRRAPAQAPRQLFARRA